MFAFRTHIADYSCRCRGAARRRRLSAVAHRQGTARAVGVAPYRRSRSRRRRGLAEPTRLRSVRPSST
jgi:hypothetical protein